MATQTICDYCREVIPRDSPTAVDLRVGGNRIEANQGHPYTDGNFCDMQHAAAWLLEVIREVYPPPWPPVKNKLWK
jgi:hypothetical protein